MDLDGTLADSLGVLKAVYRQFLSERGCVPADAEFAALNGPPLKDVVRRLRDAHGIADDAPALVAQYLALVSKRYLEAPPNPGALELVHAAKRLGWASAVVTSNAEALAGAWLASHGFVVAAVVGQESVTSGKPAAEPYVVALERLGCRAEDAIAVEDSPAGLASALAAGVRTLAFVPPSSEAHEANGALPAGITVVERLADVIPWLSRD